MQFLECQPQFSEIDTLGNSDRQAARSDAQIILVLRDGRDETGNRAGKREPGDHEGNTGAEQNQSCSTSHLLHDGSV